MPETAKRVTPEMFFDKLVPEHLKKIGKNDIPNEGKFVFRVTGENGGEWTIDLGRRRVSRGGVEPRDAYIEMGREDFMAALTRNFDWLRATSEDRFKVEGSPEMLAALGQLFIMDDKN